MSVQWNDLEFAFMAANSGPISAAWIHRERSLVRTADELVEQDLPAPINDPEWVEIPSAETLGLKDDLVQAFTRDRCPWLTEAVQRCFRKRGAWGAFKDLLDAHGLIDDWEEFEQACTRNALLAWAAENSITVVSECAQAWARGASRPAAAASAAASSFPGGCWISAVPSPAASRPSAS
jgi:hypothetical protein